MEDKDLWPDFENIPFVRGPIAILAEQAKFLSDKTKNILLADVRHTNNTNGKITVQFNITAPLLNNYSYSLLYLEYDIFSYPCTIYFNGNRSEISDEKSLTTNLQSIFSNEITKRVIGSLLGQSREAA